MKTVNVTVVRQKWLVGTALKSKFSS